MTSPQQKLVQYLNEAHATEIALTRVLQSQIAMTPRGSYRSALETHLIETRDHRDRVARRLKALGQGENPLQAVVGLAENVVGQVLALSKTPLDLLRGSGGEEKVLKNAKDTAATEALEIATYTAIERVARAVGDEETAKLAASIRADEEKMLERVLREVPKLADAVVRAEIDGDRSYDVATTGAVEAVKRAGPAPAQSDLPISRYDSLTADEITSRLPGLSQTDLAVIDAYERRGQDRTTVLDRIDALRGDEPWAGYDELTAAEVLAALTAGDEGLAATVRGYERAHKNRSGVVKAAERQHSNA
jgi:ferritin-like metal-binding protein YciE